MQPQIWCDNISSIARASNPVFHSRTKHFEVDYHYVREKVVRGELLVNYICSQDQLADLFTNGLSSSRLNLLVSKLPVVPQPVSLRARAPGGGALDEVKATMELLQLEESPFNSNSCLSAIPSL